MSVPATAVCRVTEVLACSARSVFVERAERLVVISVPISILHSCVIARIQNQTWTVKGKVSPRPTCQWVDLMSTLFICI